LAVRKAFKNGRHWEIYECVCVCVVEAQWSDVKGSVIMKKERWQFGKKKKNKRLKPKKKKKKIWVKNWHRRRVCNTQEITYFDSY
jgi:hypothetical protein